MDDADIGVLFGTLFYAMLCAVGPERAAVACDSLRADANDLRHRPRVQRAIWHTLSIVDPVKDDHSEEAKLMRASEASEARSRFKLIKDGVEFAPRRRNPNPAPMEGNIFPDAS